MRASQVEWLIRGNSGIRLLQCTTLPNAWISLVPTLPRLTIHVHVFDLPKLPTILYISYSQYWWNMSVWKHSCIEREQYNISSFCLIIIVFLYFLLVYKTLTKNHVKIPIYDIFLLFSRMSVIYVLVKSVQRFMYPRYCVCFDSSPQVCNSHTFIFVTYIFTSPLNIHIHLLSFNIDRFYPIRFMLMLFSMFRFHVRLSYIF